MDQPREITLSGEHLDRARSTSQTAIQSLLSLDEEMFKALGRDTRVDEIVEVRFTRAKVAEEKQNASDESDESSNCYHWHDMQGGCVEYCDPPGICRPCGPEQVLG